MSSIGSANRVLLIFCLAHIQLYRCIPAEHCLSAGKRIELKAIGYPGFTLFETRNLLFRCTPVHGFLTIGFYQRLFLISVYVRCGQFFYAAGQMAHW